MEYVLIGAALLLAFSNGANDNFKGFATVWGSETLSYRRALALATLATVAGSLLSLLLADGLVQAFSGKGLVPDAVAAAPLFIASVGGGAALTVLIATRTGFPISTTHALIGGLVGAGLALNAGAVDASRLASSFLLPLLLSPILSAVLGLAVYRVARRRPVEADCVCVTPAAVMQPEGSLALLDSGAAVVVAPDAACDAAPVAARFSISRLLDNVHIASATAICFARAVNDTPKLAALLIAAAVLDAAPSMATVAVAMAIGGIMAGRRVAVTMSQRITRLDPTQGVSANLITAALVLGASNFGLPVSTTHVAVGSIAGTGLGAGTLDGSALRSVLLSWVATLPIAAAIAWIVATLVGAA